MAASVTTATTEATDAGAVPDHIEAARRLADRVAAHDGRLTLESRTTAAR